MKDSDPPCSKVFFREYYLDIGVKLKRHLIIIGELLGYSQINTPSGWVNVWIVVVNHLEVFYVPKSSLRFMT